MLSTQPYYEIPTNWKISFWKFGIIMYVVAVHHEYAPRICPLDNLPEDFADWPTVEAG